MKYCFLDLETTGFDAENDSILEVAVVIRDTDRQELHRLDTVVIPHNSELTPHVTHITGITPQEVHEKGVPFSSLQEELTQVLKDTVIIGHNIDFDIQFLIANGIPIQENPRIDTHELARIILPNEESYALEVLAQKYGFAHHSAHRAMSDVEANEDLYFFLVDCIQSSPLSFRKSFQEFFALHPHWFAQHLFLETRVCDSPLSENTLIDSVSPSFLDEGSDLFQSLPLLTQEDSLFIQQGITQKSVECIHETVHTLVKQGSQVCVVTPFPHFFPHFSRFLSPKELLDTNRLDMFLEKRKVLQKEEIPFYLKCRYRSFLHKRTRDECDLFFKERDYWNEVCATSDSNVFIESLQKQSAESILVITPQEFFEFSHLEIFKERTLCIDESEMFASSLLFGVSHLYSLRPYLNHEEESISMATQFWVSRFCSDIFEPKLQRTFSVFPEKILLESTDVFPEFADQLDAIDSDETIQKLKQFLTTSSSTLTRWMEYYPETGNLSFGEWSLDEWQKQKENLQQWKKIFFHRHNPSESRAFFRIFLKSSEGHSVVIPSFNFQAQVLIPDNLVSVKSPDFVAYCAAFLKEKIQELVSPTSFLVANISSLESLKKIHHELYEFFIDTDITLLGEKVMGGDGKVLHKLKNSEKTAFIEQKISSPILSELPFETLVFQKFIFNPPHPLLESLESKMKAPGISFWDVWVVPHVVANVSRRIGQYPHLKHIYWLDARSNSGWGKSILRDIFSRF